MMGFGQHLMIDGYGGERDRLEDLEGLYRFLDEYPAKMGMTKIMPPYVFKYKGSKPKDWGLSGVVLIAESHISIHTFPEKGFVSVDLFSCKWFDTEAAVKEVEETFGLKKLEVNHLDRGREFPKEIEKATDIVRQDRLVRFG
ncbi:MAG: adenosylmethionine decarboxylase [bacterium]|nr:adenosylmethionine decarboxylase [bacterium]